MKKYILSIILFLGIALAVNAQESRLAQQYFNNGEFEKASAIYGKLYKKNARNDYYFSKYLDCLIELEDFVEAEKTLKKQIKKQPKNVSLYVLYGNLIEKQAREEEANKLYKKAIKELGKDHRSVGRLASEFQKLLKYDLAIEAYEKGGKILDDKNIFAYNLARLYGQKGDNPKMIRSYLDAIKRTPSLAANVKTQFTRNFSTADFEEVQTQLYERIQEDDSSTIYPELLTWVFVHKKDYKNALRQTKAIDRRMNEGGARVYRLSQTAARAKDYDVAIDGYDYIVENKGASSAFYVDAKRESLRCQRLKLVGGFQYTDEDLRTLETKYEAFLEEFGRKKTTATIIAELADLEAFYLNDLDKAISLLDTMIQYPGINKHVQARGKISLADFYLMQGEIWESTLLYSQVDKAFKDDLLGQEARFRNAKLSYYAGDFAWAQAQFDVLKASTSKLIANDALDMSVFIMDNLGLDTTVAPLMIFSQADLLTFQNKFEEAFTKLDSIKTLFPEHSLEDDVFYTKSKIYYKKRDFIKTGEMLQTIIDKYPESIRVDNALFELAEMYEQEFQLNDKEKAAKLYERILFEHSGSTFSVEARKRYRQLIGDAVQ